MTGEQLRQKLTDLGVNQADVARKIGATPQAFSNRLKAKQVRLDFIKKIEDVINKSVYPHQGDHLSHAEVKEVMESYRSRDGRTRQDKRSVQFVFEASFDDKLTYRTGLDQEPKKEFQNHYERIADLLFIPKPTITYLDRYPAPNDKNFEVTEAAAVFVMENVNFAQVRAFEDIFKSIAYYQKSVMLGYPALDFRINLFEVF